MSENVQMKIKTFQQSVVTILYSVANIGYRVSIEIVNMEIVVWWKEDIRFPAQCRYSQGVFYSSIQLTSVKYEWKFSNRWRYFVNA